MNFFQILKYITEEKKLFNLLTEEEIKNINPFMLNKYLSQNKDYIDIINYIQFIPYEEKEKYYKIYNNLIPLKKVWLQLPKSKDKQPNKDLLNYLVKYFECSQKEIKDYLSLMDKQQVKEILENMGVEDKEIQKLLK